jgi:diguanylate cyclase (GGDEF)-like protein/PAS domain S-box-containing protein
MSKEVPAGDPLPRLIVQARTGRWRRRRNEALPPLMDGARQALLRQRLTLQRCQRELVDLQPYREGLDQHSIMGVTDASGRITQVNTLFCRLTGYERHELIGQDHRILNSGHHPRAFFTEMWRTIGAGRVWRGEVCNRAKDGHLYWVDTTIVPSRHPRNGERRYISIRTDISERKRMEDALRLAAETDLLTCLDNRLSLMRRLRAAVVAGRNAPFAVLSIDLDHFRRINDTLGHQQGDALLRVMAQRLEATLRSRGLALSACCARSGGDQFAVLLERLHDPIADTENFCAALKEALGEPVALAGCQFQISASIGVAIGGGTGHGDTDAEAMLRDAEAAMAEAKRQGRGRHVLCDATMRATFERVTRLASDLQVALSSDQVHVVYQPIVDSGDGRLVSMEALVRWRHPVLGPVSPAEFIPIAEQTGLVVELGRQVLMQACLGLAQCRELLGAHAPRYVSVNVSRMQLQQRRGLVADVERALAASGLPPACLQLEVTETAAMNEDSMAEVLLQLHAMGVSIALDDFGTGYSSLACLQQMPLATVKLDRRFVTRLAEGTPSWAILQACTTLSEVLGFVTVAEGIETAEQAAALRRLGCTLLQGFHFARPMGMEALVEWARQREAPACEPALDTRA